MTFTAVIFGTLTRHRYVKCLKRTLRNWWKYSCTNHCVVAVERKKANLRCCELTHRCDMRTFLGNRIAPGRRLPFRKTWKRRAIVRVFLLISSISPIGALSVIALVAHWKLNQQGSSVLSVVLENCHHFALHPVGATDALVLDWLATSSNERNRIAKLRYQTYASNAVAYAAHEWKK